MCAYKLPSHRGFKNKGTIVKKDNPSCECLFFKFHCIKFYFPLERKSNIFKEFRKKRRKTCQSRHCVCAYIHNPDSSGTWQIKFLCINRKHNKAKDICLKPKH